MTSDRSVSDAADRYRQVVASALSGPEIGGSGFRIAFARCESPIEQAFCLTLFQIPGVIAVDGDFTAAQVLTAFSMKDRLILVYAQQPILRYRADFLLVGLSPLRAEPIFVIAECDGEAFHSSREQLRRDVGRQQELANTGFGIIRFSGRAIFRSPEEVAATAIREFSSHGWDPSDSARRVGNQALRRALSELREAAGDELEQRHRRRVR
jgi:very-short-patch-repair endonuclease